MEEKTLNITQFIKGLYNTGRLEAAVLKDYEGKHYDIVSFLYKDINDEYVFLDYVYGATNYENEREAILDNAEIIMDKLLGKIMNGKMC
jgi:hypothetical protein